eukprot:ctg_2229.g492
MGRGGVLWRVRRGPYGDRATIDAKRDASLGNWAGREAGATAGELMARADRETGENTRGERTADRTEDADDREQVANGTRGRASTAAADRTGCMGAEGDGSAMGIKRRRRVYCGSLCRVPTPAMLTAPNNRIDVEAAAAAPTTSPDAQLAAEPAEPVSVAADTVAAPSAAKTDDEEAVGRTLATETECAEVFAMDGADKGAEEHPTMSTAAEGDTPAVAVDPGAEHPSPPLDARFTPKRCRCGTAHIPPAGRAAVSVRSRCPQRPAVSGSGHLAGGGRVASADDTRVCRRRRRPAGQVVQSRGEPRASLRGAAAPRQPRPMRRSAGDATACGQQEFVVAGAHRVAHPADTASPAGVGTAVHTVGAAVAFARIGGAQLCAGAAATATTSTAIAAAPGIGATGAAIDGRTA